jgi:hypothetical protein
VDREPVTALGAADEEHAVSSVPHSATTAGADTAIEVPRWFVSMLT